MTRFVLASALVLTMMAGTAAAETFTGPITTTFEGLGVNSQQIQVGGKWLTIGCGPDSDLSDELMKYLDDHWDATGSITGDAVNDPQWGLCIDNPGLAVDVEPEPDQAVAGSKLAQYGWLKLPKDISAAEMKVLEVTLTEPYYDPLFRAPLSSFIGVCKYFHARGFTVEVKAVFSKWKNPEPKSGKTGEYSVRVKAVLPEDDSGLFMPLMVLYDNPSSQEALRKVAGTDVCMSVVDISEIHLTESYAKDEWYNASQADWLVIMKPIIEKGYVTER